MAAREVELRLLRAFVLTAEERHFGRAAARLYLSQPALSKQIRALEHDWGVTLFRRGPRSVVLTAEGTDLLTAAQETLAAAARLTERVDRFDPAVPERLHVGFVGQAANELTPLLVQRFARDRPDVVVDLRQYPFRDLSAGIRDGGVDLGIVRLPISLERLRLRRLFVEPRVAVLPARHPLAGAPRLSVDDLLDEPWIQPASDDPLYRAFALALGRRAAAPLLGPVVHTIDELLEAVLAGRGICLAPASAARYYARPGITYVDVADADPSIVAFAWSDEPGRPTPTAAAFVAAGVELAGSASAPVTPARRPAPRAARATAPS